MIAAGYDFREVYREVFAIDVSYFMYKFIHNLSIKSVIPYISVYLTFLRHFLGEEGVFQFPTLLKK